MTTHSFRIVVFTWCLLALPVGAADTVRFQLDWLPGGDKAPVYVGVQQGFFAEEGLEVVINQGRGSTDSITRLATGVADIGIADLAALMVARTRDEVAVTGLMSVFSAAPHVFYVLEGSGIESVAQVAGKRLATSPFTSSNVFLDLLLERNGVAPGSYKLLKADAGALSPMLITGKVDAVVSWVTHYETYSAQASELGRRIRTLPWYEAGMDIYATSLMANDRFIAANPGVVQRFMRAFERAIAYTWAHPDAAAQMVATMVPEVDKDVAAATIRAMRPVVYNEGSLAAGIGAFDPERLGETWEWVALAQGFAPDDLDPETVIARELMRGIVPVAAPETAQ